MTHKTAVLLIHGFAGRDDRPASPYWGRIPEVLGKRGYQVYLSGQDAWGTVEHNALQVKARMEAIMAEDGVDSFHLLAHSKGGLEGRLLLSRLGMAPVVKSLITLGTPHAGLSLVDWATQWPRLIQNWGYALFDELGSRAGDEKPATRGGMEILTAENIVRFNEETPDAAGVYYYSVAAHLADVRCDLDLALTKAMIERREGANDGLVSVRSALRYAGEVWTSEDGGGISHHDLCDMHGRELRILSSTRGERVFTLFELYECLLQEAEAAAQPSMPVTS